MLKTPLTKEGIKTHFHYNAWKYFLLIVLVIVFVNIFFTTTRYRSPAELKVEVYVSSSGASQEAFQHYLDEAHEAILPEMEEVSCVMMASNDGSDPYTTMQLSTYIMVGEGDIYLLSKDDFKSYAQQGAFLNLDPYIDSGALVLNGLDISKGLATYSADEGLPSETHQYGIPADEMFGFWDFMVDNRDKVLCILQLNGNDDNSIKLLNHMCSTLTKPMPELAEESE